MGIDGWMGGCTGKWMLHKALGQLQNYYSPIRTCSPLSPSPLFSETSLILYLQIREAYGTAGVPIAPLSSPSLASLSALITSNTPYFFTDSVSPHHTVSAPGGQPLCDFTVGFLELITVPGTDYVLKK